MAGQISFEAQGMDELVDRMKRAGTVGRISINDGLREIGRLIVPAKGTGPLAKETPKVTGKLAKSTIFQVTGGPRDQRLEVRQGARSPQGVFYGALVREGTAPHEIRPRDAQALRFMVGGDVVFAKVVQHPGTKPNPYHERVLRRLRMPIQKIVTRMGRKITAHLSGR